MWLRATRGDGDERPEPAGENIWRLADESWAMLGQTVCAMSVDQVQHPGHAGWSNGCVKATSACRPGLQRRAQRERERGSANVFSGDWGSAFMPPRRAFDPTQAPLPVTCSRRNGTPCTRTCMLGRGLWLLDGLLTPAGDPSRAPTSLGASSSPTSASAWTASSPSSSQPARLSRRA